MGHTSPLPSPRPPCPLARPAQKRDVSPGHRIARAERGRNTHQVPHVLDPPVDALGLGPEQRVSVPAIAS
eukprot:1538688-Rhodomonas_salina.1